MTQKLLRAEIAVDAAGNDVTVYVPLIGVVHAVSYQHGDLAAGTDITITDEATTSAVLALTNQAADGRWMPRVPVHDAVGAAIAGAYTAPPVGGRAKVVVAQGGANHRGVVILHVETEGVI